MSDALRLGLAGALAAGVVLAVTPLVIRVAWRTRFLDHPAGYKVHGSSTPYLGGAAVLAGLLAGAALLTDDLAGFAPLAACLVAIWIVGTVDDRVLLQPQPRLAATAAIAIVLHATGWGWSLGPEPVELVLTVLWVLAVVNAFNLMDNMDGATAAVGSSAAAGIAALALLAGDVSVAVPCVALAGACIAFLRFNLARPARIFLGDGGSMPVGLLLAASTMSAGIEQQAGWPGLVIAGLLVGVPLTDVALVVRSRRRCGAPLLVGGNDHITHRLKARLGTPHAVAATLAATQLALGAAAALLWPAGTATLVVAGLVATAAAVAAVAVFDSAAWRHREAAEARSEPPESVPGASRLGHGLVGPVAPRRG